MRPIWCLAAAVMVGVWAFEPRIAAQKEQQIFVSITAPNGTPVTDLQAAEVSVTEDGVDCKIVKLEPVSWPIKLHVLVDNGKPNTNPINSLRDGLKALFEQMPDGVEMSMYATAGTPRPIVKATTDKKKLIDGISLINPDSGVGAFFDALSEAGDRIDKDKAQNFPVIVMIGSDLGRVNVPDRDFQKLQQTIRKHAVTVHIVVMGGTGGTGGGIQTELGLALTKMTGGSYENINSSTRLATLLPEWGKKIAEADGRQRHQYRVTYERPANAKEQPRVGAAVRREGTPMISLDGHLP